MRVVARIDPQGLYLEDVLLEEGKPTPEGCIESRPQAGFHSPKWTGSEWIEGELESEILDAAKEAKIHEFAARAVEDLDATGLFTSSHGDRETLFVLAKTLAAICTQLGIPLDTRLEALAQAGEKAMQKKAAIEQAATLEELEAIGWTP